MSGTGYPSGFGADGSAEEEFLSTPTTALVALGCSPPSGSIKKKMIITLAQSPATNMAFVQERATGLSLLFFTPDAAT